MEKTKGKMKLTSLDDIFSTQEERDSIGNIIKVPLKDIDNFPEHPFKVLVNEELNEMMESIKEKGVLVPTIVRPKPDGRYEMISGHRRKKASELLDLESIPCIVRNLTDDEATIIMVDSNLQREKILPSERAFAYKMKLEALKHQGERIDLTSAPMVHKSDSKTSRDIIADETGDSREQVRRYIRLTELIPKLLEMVDKDVIAFRPAVEISYLNKEEQTDLLDLMECYDCTPSLAQAIKLKKLSQENNLTVDDMEELLSQEKPNQIPKLKISMERLTPVLPDYLKSDEDREEYIIKAVAYFKKVQERKKEQQER